MQVNRNQSVQSAQALVDAFLSIKRSKGLTEGTIGHYRKLEKGKLSNELNEFYNENIHLLK